MTKKTAIITGASKGFGKALAESFAKKGWQLLINARNAKALLATQRRLQKFTQKPEDVQAISGDVRDEIHLLQFVEKLEQLGWKIDLLVNNASTLGASPQPPLLEYKQEAIHQIFHTNIIAPLSLIQKLKDRIKDGATIVNMSSDAAVNAYENWGGYGASKAGLDHMTAILGKENPQWKVYAFDPGDMRTEMHQAAFPNENINDRPLPESKAVPAVLELISGAYSSGRHTVDELSSAFVE